DPVTLQAVGGDADLELLRLTAEADDVDDAGDLFELALEDPVLRRLEVLDGVPLSLHGVAEDLADRVPRRDRGLTTGAATDELKAVQHLLPRLGVLRPPLEVALHVAEAEKRLRPNVVETRHPREPDLERDRDVALGLFRAPTGGLRDDLDEWG